MEATTGITYSGQTILPTGLLSGSVQASYPAALHLPYSPAVTQFTVIVPPSSAMLLVALPSEKGM